MIEYLIACASIIIAFRFLIIGKYNMQIIDHVVAMNNKATDKLASKIGRPKAEFDAYADVLDKYVHDNWDSYLDERLSPLTVMFDVSRWTKSQYFEQTLTIPEFK